MSDLRIHAPAAGRNRDAILTALRPLLPASGLVLEVASGTGEHVTHFAAAMPGLVFQPSDPEADRRASIDAWAGDAALANVRPAMALDASASEWDIAAAGVVLCFNMIHIAPWQAAVGLVTGAGRLLGQGGLLALYGPFRRGGDHTAPSNAEFDADLRRRDPRWGVRNLEDVVELAAEAGFSAPQVITMPANNLLIAFVKE